MNEIVSHCDRVLIDVGNTRIKALPYQFRDGAVCFDRDALWVRHDRCFERAFHEVFAAIPKPADVWVSNVSGDAARQALEAVSNVKFGLEPNFVCVERHRNGVQNNYQNLDELGVDRWMAIQGARQLLYGHDDAIIVIGCGTAITVDVVSVGGEFIGGAILPGLELAARSLSRTDGIPQFDFAEYTRALGTSTADCVRLGVVNACAGGVEKIVASVIAEFSSSPIQIVASGGAAQVVLAATNIDFKYDANLVLRGLQCVANERLG